MSQRFKEFKIQELFTVQSGDVHALSELDNGNVPLISCGEINNGFIGRFDVPADRQYQQAITVAYNGSWPLTSKFHPYKFGTKDDVAVLVPARKLTTATLLYAAAMLNRMIWRYSYGRKCFKEKLQDVRIMMPIKGDEEIDEDFTEELLAAASDNVKGQASESAKSVLNSLRIPPTQSDQSPPQKRRQRGKPAARAKRG